MPMPLFAIPSFETRNHCAIIVCQLENTKLVLVHHSKIRKGRSKIDLLPLLKKNINAWLKNLRACFTFIPDLNLNERDQSNASVEIVFNPLSKKTSKSMFTFAQTMPHLRFECLSSQPHFSLWVERRLKSTRLLCMLIWKQSMWEQKVYPMPILGLEKLKDNDNSFGATLVDSIS